MKISELAALLGVSAAWAWRLVRERRQLRVREVGGVLTVDAREALDLKRRRDADPPNARRGRKTYFQSMQDFTNRNSGAASTAEELAEGRSGQHPDTRGKQDGSRPASLAQRRAAAAP